MRLSPLRSGDTRRAPTGGALGVQYVKSDAQPSARYRRRASTSIRSATSCASRHARAQPRRGAVPANRDRTAGQWTRLRSSSFTYTIVISGARNGPPSLEPRRRQAFCCSSRQHATADNRRLFNDRSRWEPHLVRDWLRKTCQVFCEISERQARDSVQVNPEAVRKVYCGTVATWLFQSEPLPSLKPPS